MLSQRRKAEIGLLSACLLMASTLTILYRGSKDIAPAAPRTPVVHNTPAAPPAPVLKIAQLNK